MSFAFNVHTEQHLVTINGKEYLVDIRTTRFLGCTLITKVRCCEPVAYANDLYSHVPNRDFAMTLQSDHGGKLNDDLVKQHVDAVREGLGNILNRAFDYYSFTA